MKKITRTIAYITLAAAAFGCAKPVSVGPNDANQRYFESWMSVNHPDLKPTGLGIYIMEDTEGTGETVKEGDFVYAEYTTTDLKGNISSYTDKETAKQLGTYDTTYYYGPKVISTVENTIQAGLAEAIVGMKVGGRKKVIIPSWLMSYKKYDSEEKYLQTETTGTHTVYDITITDRADSINLHEISLVEKFISENPLDYPFDSRMTNDTTGFYFQPVSGELTPADPKKDTVIYINYTGRLLNGLVFDTSVEKTAKDNGLYSSSKTYGPVKITIGEKYTDVKMGSGSSSVISGFGMTLMRMQNYPMGTGIGIFYSPLGYSFNGSGQSIPGYSPLIFEIEVVAKPEE